MVGSTFQCLIAEQFVRLKFGDRFFFTHAAHPDISNPFTIDQMNALRERNLGDILCENTAFLQAKKNVFLEGPLDLDCQDKNNLDLDLFL